MPVDSRRRIACFDCQQLNVVAGGHAVLGVSLRPVTGKLVSQIAAGDKSLISLGPLALERF